MIEDRIAARYAEPLFSLANEHGQADTVLEDLKSVANLIRASADFRAFLHSPVITSDRKRPILDAIFEGKLSDITLQTISLLTSRGREVLLMDIADEYERVYNKANNIVKASVTSAQELDSATVDQLSAKLKEIYEANIQLETDENPDLIGGMVVQVEDRQFDGSIRYALQRARRNLN